MREHGFTLVELMVVITITGILLTIATHNWTAMQTKLAIERQAKTLHADLMQVRLQSLFGKKSRSVVINGQLYKLYSSTDTTVPPIVTKQLRYPVVWNSRGALTFDAQGLTNSERTLCIVPTNDTSDINSAVVDSIVVSEARINLGKRRDGEECKSAKIDQK
jgi:type IV fimbrial biogenesis protein FimT